MKKQYRLRLTAKEIGVLIQALEKAWSGKQRPTTAGLLELRFKTLLEAEK